MKRLIIVVLLMGLELVCLRPAGAANKSLTLAPPTPPDHVIYVGTRCLRRANGKAGTVAGCFDLYRLTQDTDPKYDYYAVDLSAAADPKQSLREFTGLLRYPQGSSTVAMTTTGTRAATS